MRIPSLCKFTKHNWDEMHILISRFILGHPSVSSVFDYDSRNRVMNAVMIMNDTVIDKKLQKHESSYIL